LTGSDLTVLALLLESAVVLAEFFLLRWLFGRLVRRGTLEGPVSNARLWWAALAANAASFALCFVALNLSIFWRSWALGVWSPW